MPYTAHADELAAAKLDELSLELSESDHKTTLKRIESLLYAVKPSTPKVKNLKN
ncbi:hypothetical protein [Vibrio coralliilyticus]|uniref:hypothetical protein n=1 Tax=Vibrio coralliilyticus TaxID=190893 RepID=UPI0020A29401|nr:hypothetical protein [Vibrio coralliilyticus]